MAVLSKSGHLRQGIENGGEFILPYREVFEQAIQTGFSQRLRGIHPVVFILTLLTHRSAHKKPTIRELRDAYVLLTGVEFEDPNDVITYSSFYARFNDKLLGFIKAILLSSMNMMDNRKDIKLKDNYSKFRQIYLLDNTIIRLHEKLADQFPAARTRNVGKSAGLKLSVLFNATASSPSSIAVNPERTHDIKTLNIGKWVQDKLIIMDLGFFKLWNFVKISEFGGYFLVRLKSNANPIVKKILAPDIGEKASEFIGKPVKEVLSLLPPGEVAMEVTVNFRRRKYKKKTGKLDSYDFICVAQYNDEAQRWHTYLTNLDLDSFSVKEICALYAFRWTIELLFKEIKSDNELGKFKSVNIYLNESMIFTSILRTIITRRFYLLAIQHQQLSDFSKIHPLLFSRIFIENIRDIAKILRKEVKHGQIQNDEWIEHIRLISALSHPIKRADSDLIQVAQPVK